MCVCVFLVFLPVFAFRGGGKEGRKEGQRDKSEGEWWVRDMNYYRALVHGKGADRGGTLFVKYNFERFGRQEFFPPFLLPSSLSLSKRRRLHFASSREGFLFPFLSFKFLNFNSFSRVREREFYTIIVK